MIHVPAIHGKIGSHFSRGMNTKSMDPRAQEITSNSWDLWLFIPAKPEKYQGCMEHLG
jgi:hypothetical protein